MTMTSIGRLAASLLLGAVATMAGADDYTDFLREAQAGYAAFRDSANTAYADFRKEALAEYAKFMKAPWVPTPVDSVIPAPPDRTPVPPRADSVPTPAPPRPVVIDSVIDAPTVPPAPSPVLPTDEEDGPVRCSLVKVRLYGTNVVITAPDLSQWRIYGTAENDFAEAWKTLADMSGCDMISGCLKVREDMGLCDWAYIELAKRVAAEAIKDESRGNERELLTGFLLSQSGYKIRYALDGSKLIVLFGTKGMIYGRPYFTVDGSRYFPIDDIKPSSVRICDIAYPQEQEVYLGLRHSMNLAYRDAGARTIDVHGRPGCTLTLNVNRNLIDFYNDMPECSTTSEANTKWAMYASVEASPEFREQLYPQLKGLVEGKTQLEAVGTLLLVAQSLPYGSDNEIWGRDRAFFPDESWAYEAGDCEDHAIHFARLVRDVAGLDVALVLYDNHMAAAVRITDGTATGDYLEYKGVRWTVCDPTYFYAGVGSSMPSQNASTARLIFLPK